MTAVILAAVISFSCAPPATEEISGFNKGIIASPDSIATEVGLEILRNGGNAFDAAVAVGFTLAVTHPKAGNIGGGGFAVLYNSDSDKVFALDFRETAPQAATKDMYLNETGDVIPNLSTMGFLASGTPGTVAGLLELQNRFGSKSAMDLIMPALNLARNGFIVDSALVADFANYYEQFSQYQSTRKYFGNALQVGDLLTQSDLADVLETIAQQGVDGFYRGEVALKIAQEMKKGGGIISENDLAEYQSIWRDPIEFEYSKLKIYSMPPPSSGGLVMGEIFGIMQRFDISGRNYNDPWYINLFVECCKLAYADRSKYMGDPDFVHNPAEMLFSPEYLYTRSREIDTSRASASVSINPGLEIIEFENTTHFSIVDSAHNIVSLTYTLNSSFGCKQVVDGLGFFMNNEMDDFAIKPGHANIYGLIGGQANAIASGKRMLSSMSPTIVFYDNKPTMVVGTPGGSKIITAVTSTILNFFGFGLSLDSAVNLPHYHHQWLPDKLYYEQGAFSQQLLDTLTMMGHNLQERYDYGDLQTVLIYPNGIMTGVSDRRGSGFTSGY